MNSKLPLGGGLNLGKLPNNNNLQNFAQQAYQNTVNILNKTLANFGQLPFGNLDNINLQQSTTQSISINNQNQKQLTVTPSVNTLVSSTEKVEQNRSPNTMNLNRKRIPGIDDDFPVIDLNPKDIRR